MTPTYLVLDYGIAFLAVLLAFLLLTIVGLELADLCSGRRR
jgi:hypothetical protein